MQAHARDLRYEKEWPGRCMNVYRWHDKWAHKNMPAKCFLCSLASLRATMETVLFSIKHSFATWCQWVSKTRSRCTTTLDPPSPYCMVTKHTDRQSKSRQPSLCSCLWRLTSVPDKTSQPFPQLLLRVHTRLKVCKLCNWHIDICMYTLHPAKCLHCSQSVAGANTQRMNPSALYKVSYNS